MAIFKSYGSEGSEATVEEETDVVIGRPPGPPCQAVQLFHLTDRRASRRASAPLGSSIVVSVLFSSSRVRLWSLVREQPVSGPSMALQEGHLSLPLRRRADRRGTFPGRTRSTGSPVPHSSQLQNCVFTRRAPRKIGTAGRVTSAPTDAPPRSPTTHDIMSRLCYRGRAGAPAVGRSRRGSRPLISQPQGVRPGLSAGPALGRRGLHITMSLMQQPGWDEGCWVQLLLSRASGALDVTTCDGGTGSSRRAQGTTPPSANHAPKQPQIKPPPHGWSDALQLVITLSRGQNVQFTLKQTRAAGLGFHPVSWPLGRGTDLMRSDRRELISLKRDLICGMNVGPGRSRGDGVAPDRIMTENGFGTGFFMTALALHACKASVGLIVRP
ncbi:unnamed protein product [Lota lota]